MKSIQVSLLSLLIASLLTHACKKDQDKQASCRITRLIKNDGQTYNFTYDDGGKLTSMLTMPQNEISSFEYNGNNTRITVTNNGQFKYRLLVTSNAAGLSTNVLLEQNEAGTDWFNQSITYENRKVISNEFSDSGGDTATGDYIWEAGNPSIYVVDGDIFHYKYYNDKRFQPGDWRYIQQLIAGYRLYEYENLLQQSVISGNTTYYTYKFDEAGRITTATASSANNTTAFNLEYTCK